MNWYAIYTKPKSEDSIAHLLRNAGFETLNPKIKVVKYVRKKYVDVIEQLFPSYIFAFFDSDKHSHMIRYTRGVRYVIGQGYPIIVPDEIINAIKERMKDGVVIPVPEDFSKGERVMIKEGPFKNFYGIFEKNIPGRKRAMILLETLFCKVDLDIRSIKKA